MAHQTIDEEVICDLGDISAISGQVMAKMKPTCNILNFARAEIVDTNALLKKYSSGHKGAPRLSSHESRVASRESRVASRESRVASSNDRV